MGVLNEQAIWSNTPGYITYTWYNECNFSHFLLEVSSLQKGNIISIIRREIDLLRQMEKVVKDNPMLLKKVKDIRKKIDKE